MRPAAPKTSHKGVEQMDALNYINLAECKSVNDVMGCFEKRLGVQLDGVSRELVYEYASCAYNSFQLGYEEGTRGQHLPPVNAE